MLFHSHQGRKIDIINEAEMKKCKNARNNWRIASKYRLDELFPRNNILQIIYYYY